MKRLERENIRVIEQVEADDINQIYYQLGIKDLSQLESLNELQDIEEVIITIIFGEFFNNLVSELELYTKHIIQELDYSKYEGPIEPVDRLSNKQFRQIFYSVFSARGDLFDLVSIISRDLYVRENYDSLQDIIDFAWADAKVCSKKLDQVYDDHKRDMNIAITVQK